MPAVTPTSLTYYRNQRTSLSGVPRVQTDSSLPGWQAAREAGQQTLALSALNLARRNTNKRQQAINTALNTMTEAREAARQAPTSEAVRSTYDAALANLPKLAADLGSDEDVDIFNMTIAQRLSQDNAALQNWESAKLFDETNVITDDVMRQAGADVFENGPTYIPVALEELETYLNEKMALEIYKPHQVQTLLQEASANLDKSAFNSFLAGERYDDGIAWLDAGGAKYTQPEEMAIMRKNLFDARSGKILGSFDEMMYNYESPGALRMHFAQNVNNLNDSDESIARRRILSYEQSYKADTSLQAQVDFFRDHNVLPAGMSKKDRDMVLNTAYYQDMAEAGFTPRDFGAPAPNDPDAMTRHHAAVRWSRDWLRNRGYAPPGMLLSAEGLITANDKGNQELGFQQYDMVARTLGPRWMQVVDQTRGTRIYNLTNALMHGKMPKGLADGKTGTTVDPTIVGANEQIVRPWEEANAIARQLVAGGLPPSLQTRAAVEEVVAAAGVDWTELVADEFAHQYAPFLSHVPGYEWVGGVSAEDVPERVVSMVREEVLNKIGYDPKDLENNLDSVLQAVTQEVVSDLYRKNHIGWSEAQPVAGVYYATPDLLIGDIETADGRVLPGSYYNHETKLDLMVEAVRRSPELTNSGVGQYLQEFINLENTTIAEYDPVFPDPEAGTRPLYDRPGGMIYGPQQPGLRPPGIAERFHDKAFDTLNRWFLGISEDIDDPVILDSVERVWREMLSDDPAGARGPGAFDNPDRAIFWTGKRSFSKRLEAYVRTRHIMETGRDIDPEAFHTNLNYALLGNHQWDGVALEPVLVADAITTAQWDQGLVPSWTVMLQPVYDYRIDEPYDAPAKTMIFLPQERDLESGYSQAWRTAFGGDDPTHLRVFRESISNRVLNDREKEAERIVIMTEAQRKIRQRRRDKIDEMLGEGAIRMLQDRGFGGP